MIIKCSASANACGGQKQASDDGAAGDGQMHRQVMGGLGRPLRSHGQSGVIPQTPRAVICSFCFLLRQRLRSQLLCGALGFRPATCAEARLCPPKRHILRAPPAPPSHPTALVFLKSQLSPRTPFHRRLQFGETWPPPHASERRKQILTKPCWRINLSTGGGRARAAG